MQRRLPEARLHATRSRSITAALNVGELERFAAGANVDEKRAARARARPGPARSHQDPRRRRAHQEAHRDGPRLLASRRSEKIEKAGGKAVVVAQASRRAD